MVCPLSKLNKTYLRVCYATVFIAIKLLCKVIDFFCRNTEPSAFNQTSKFFFRERAVFVHVEGVEGFVDVKVWLSSKSSADAFSCSLNFKMDTPHVSELISSCGVEAVIAAVDWVLVV